MSFSLEFFSNERFRLLKVIQANQTKNKDGTYADLSQQEIANIAHISKLKANKIINELIDGGFLDYHTNKRGKYSVSDHGCKVIKLMETQRK